jgi:hypothetical protein
MRRTIGSYIVGGIVFNNDGTEKAVVAYDKNDVGEAVDKLVSSQSEAEAIKREIAQSGLVPDAVMAELAKKQAFYDLSTPQGRELMGILKNDKISGKYFTYVIETGGKKAAESRYDRVKNGLKSE